MRLIESDYPHGRSRSRRWFLGFGAAWSAALAIAIRTCAAVFPDGHARAARRGIEPHAAARYVWHHHAILLHFERHHSAVPETYGQTGEPIRPEQGHPFRRLVPGWEGNVNVKWLRRIKALSEPAVSREETSKYTCLAVCNDGVGLRATLDA